MVTKGEINRAGCYLIDKSGGLSRNDAHNILKDFRFVHQHPMALFRHLIDRKLKKNNIEALVSQRLKRIPSIIKKLKIQKNMNLSRMQDIGGLRIVVEGMEEVIIIRDEIKKVEKNRNFRFILANEKDYIKKPDKSGYRSIHMIYKYEKEKYIPSYKQCRVEIQIRTKLQHSWATAVEVLGTFLNQPLKQSFGNKEYLDIFKKISQLFIGLENKKIDYEFIKEVKKDIEDTAFLEKLTNFNFVTKYLDHKGVSQGQYLLLKTNCKEQEIEIARYSSVRFKQANEDYIDMEFENLGNDAVEVVLLSIRDIKKLQQSYPNYFMDTTDFIKNLQKLFKLVEKKQELQGVIDKTKNKNRRTVLENMSDAIFKKTLELYDGGKK